MYMYIYIYVTNIYFKYNLQIQVQSSEKNTKFLLDTVSHWSWIYYRYNTTARVLDEYFGMNSIFRHFAVPGLSQDWLQQDSKGFATGAAGLWLWCTAMANLTPQETTYKRLGLGLLRFIGLCPPLPLSQIFNKTFDLSLTSFVVLLKSCLISTSFIFHFTHHEFLI